MDLETTGWSGEGEFTQTLIDTLQRVDQITFLRVEDASSSRSDVDYNFVSNELFVGFRTRERVVHRKLLGLVPVRQRVREAVMNVSGLEQTLCGLDQIGPPDYADEGMLQYLRTERIVPPYQTRGYKLVELVRVYEVGSPRRSPEEHD